MYKIDTQKQAQEFLIEALSSHNLTLGQCKRLMGSMGVTVDDAFINLAAQTALQRQIQKGHMVSTKNQYGSRKTSEDSLDLQIGVEEAILRLSGDLPGISEEQRAATKREAVKKHSQGVDDLKEAYIQRYEQALATGDQTYIKQVRQELAKEGYEI